MENVIFPQRKLPVLIKADLCVLGGSCTGVFAAVRAARLGLKVALIEKQNSFGGVATQGLVTVWHTLMDMKDQRQIIAGLTQECLERLDRRGALKTDPPNRALTYVMNTEELKIELDLLVKAEKNITPVLHASYCAPYEDGDGKLLGAVIATKSGLSVVLAERFIDATGDGDLLRDLPCPTRLAENAQPPTPGMKISGAKDMKESDFHDLLGQHAAEVGMDPDWGWGTHVPDAPDVFYFASSHIYHADISDAMSLTRAEMESRRHARGVIDLLRKYYPDNHNALVALSSYIGGRESRHASCLHKLVEEDVLGGGRIPCPIMMGTYPCDVHKNDDFGVTWKYLDGRQVYRRNGAGETVTSWLKPGQTPPDYYQAPLGLIIPQNVQNVYAAGRMVDTDQSAFGAIRVMVNLNQLGEAAGVAAYDSLNRSVPVWETNEENVHRLLLAGGSAMD